VVTKFCREIAQRLAALFKSKSDPLGPESPFLQSMAGERMEYLIHPDDLYCSYLSKASSAPCSGIQDTPSQLIAQKNATEHCD
jgi:hypothetical protein